MAVILSILILSIFAALATTIITTQSSIALQEEQGLQALYIAEGGLYYAFLNGSYCNYNGIAGALGEGNFAVSSVYSNATLSGNLTNSTSPTTVNLTAVPQIGFSNSGFTFPGMIGIDSEMLFCLGSVSNSITGCSRGKASTTAAAHLSNAAVFQCSVRSEGTVSKGLGFGTVKRSTQVNIVEVDAP